MKKSLSLLLAIAMVFGMFASMASAAETNLSTAEKYQWFVDNKILKGTPDGDVRADQELTRAEFATIAVAVAGLSQATSGQTFSDVKKGQWWYGAIEAAAKAGLVNGTGAGKFSPKANVTVESVIKVAVGIAGLQPVAGAQVSGASDWAAPYVKAALDAGIISAMDSYKAQATRGQTIDIAYAVTQTKAIPVVSDVVTTVNNDDTITVTGKVVGKADSVKVAINTNAAVAATLKDDNTFSFTSAKQVAGTYKVTVVAYDGTKESVAVEKSVTVDAFQVSSVTVQNGKQLAVKFNKAVQEGIAAGGFNQGVNAGTTTDAYFLLAGVEPLRASLSDDKTTVTLTFADFAPLNSFAQLEVKDGLKSASGQALTAYKQAVYLADTTAPSVTGVTWIGTVAKVAFSEPLDAAATGEGYISINGVQLSTVANADGLFYDVATDVDAEGDYTAVRIAGLTKDTEYTLHIVGAKDIAGNVADYTATLKVPNDTVVPTVTNLTVSGAKVIATFSEALRDQGAGLYASVVANGTTVTTADVGSSYDALKNQATFDLSSVLGGNTFVNVTAKVTGYQDLQNNAGADYSRAITLSLDTTAPALQSVTTNGLDIIAKFSEDISSASVAGMTYSFVDSEGVVFSGDLSANSTIAVGYDADNSGGAPEANKGENAYLVISVNPNTTISSATALKAGKLTVVIPAATSVTDTTGNSSGKVTLSATVSKGAASGTLQLVNVAQDALNNNKVVFTFNANLTVSQLDRAKFLMNGQALPAGTTFYFDGARTVVAAELPAGAVPVNGPRQFKVVNIVDENNNTLDSNFVTGTVTLTENTPPKAVSAAFLNDSTARVTFSEKLAATSDEAGIEVTINGIKQADTAYTVSASGADNYLDVIFAGNTFTAGQTVVVKFTGSNVVDLNSNLAADGQVTVK